MDGKDEHARPGHGDGSAASGREPDPGYFDNSPDRTSVNQFKEEQDSVTARDIKGARPQFHDLPPSGHPID